MTDNIVEWLENEIVFCQEKYDGISGEYTGHPFSVNEREEMYWYSGRIDACERLLEFISKGTDDD